MHSDHRNTLKTHAGLREGAYWSKWSPKTRSRSALRFRFEFLAWIAQPGLLRQPQRSEQDWHIQILIRLSDLKEREISSSAIIPNCWCRSRSTDRRKPFSSSASTGKLQTQISGLPLDRSFYADFRSSVHPKEH